jgi:hypothetical protein
VFCAPTSSTVRVPGNIDWAPTLWQVISVICRSRNGTCDRP